MFCAWAAEVGAWELFWGRDVFGLLIQFFVRHCLVFLDSAIRILQYPMLLLTALTLTIVRFKCFRPVLKTGSILPVHSHNRRTQPLSTEPIPLPTPKRLRSLILPLPRHTFLLMRHRRRNPLNLPPRVRMPIMPLLPLRIRLAGDVRFRLRLLRRLASVHLFRDTHALALLATLFFQCGALFAVGVDAAFGEVVGAAACEDEHAPAVAY